jgi:hypothetical protein
MFKQSCACPPDEASREKERLEQKQRESRKERAKSQEEWSTRYNTPSFSWLGIRGRDEEDP